MQQSAQFPFSWFNSSPKINPVAQTATDNLPESIRQKLIQAVQSLPPHPDSVASIQSTVESAFDHWLTSPTREANSLAIISSPVTPVALILAESLVQWLEEKDIGVRLLAWNTRPAEINTITSKLKHYLNSSQENPDNPEIVLIPNLSYCFLRSLEGLDGIDYLQRLILRDRALTEENHTPRFWLIGLDQVTWHYLNAVSHFDAYCSESFCLPPLEGKQLRSWLNHIVKEFAIEIKTLTLKEQAKEEQENIFFTDLARVSQGISTVAVEVFLQSIGYQTIEEEEGILVAKSPSLPPLPQLEMSDRYILYSFLLHGDLTLFALAESLGDDLSQVQARVEI
ncbi:MAG: ArsR family transcriptional regulator, partial [Cyanobacteria bacterium J083]